MEHLIHRVGVKDLQHLLLSRVYLDGDMKVESNTRHSIN